jgi:DNA modification methylase
MRQIIRRCHRVLAEGRFFAINISPVLLRRAARNESSRRIAVPFDFHRIFIEEGFDFIDDIIWLKPEGAGWATGRGRRFAADRNPLQYKAVPVTEYILVYRKHTDLLIDWFIRNHPNKDVIEDSKISDGYERTNVWKINPSTNSKHPAAFPKELAEKVVRYYSFKGDVVLDPFAGSGTVGSAASGLGRRFVLFDNNPDYIDIIQEEIVSWKNVNLNNVMWINCEPVKPVHKQTDLFVEEKHDH